MSNFNTSEVRDINRLIQDALKKQKSYYNIQSAQILYPESFGAIGDGVVDDTSAIEDMFGTALLNDNPKTIMFSKPEYLVASKLSMNLLGQSLEISSIPGSVLKSSATLATGKYFAFYCGHGITQPTAGAVYSNNGSQFTVLDALTPRITECILTERTSGTNNPLSTGTLTKVSGTGDATYTYTSVIDGQYYLPVGAFEFYNAANLRMSNLSFESSASGLSYFSGLLIKEVDNVILDKIGSSIAGYMGIAVYGSNASPVENLFATNCNASYNKYAGLVTAAVKHINIIGGDFSYNGAAAPTNGYGISITHQAGTGIDCEDILITGVKANYNLRKGIDLHGGIRSTVAFNYVKGFTYGGIYAVNEGANELNNLKYIKDSIIAFNQIENDQTWFNGLSFASTPNSYPLQVGSYDDVEGTYGGGEAGTIKVIHNTIKNCSVSQGGTDYLKYIINAFAGAMQSLEVDFNTLEQATCETAIYFGSNDYGQPRIVCGSHNKLIDITATNELILGTLGEDISFDDNRIRNCSGTYAVRAFEYGAFADFKNVSADRNKIDGTFGTGIDINNGDLVTVNHNKFSGTYSNGKCFNVASDLRFEAKDNVYLLDITPAEGASVNLPDYYSKSQGIARYAVESSSSIPVVIDTLTVNAGSTVAGGYDGGSLMLDIKITAGKADQVCFAIFTAQAIAGNIGGGAPYHNTTKLNMKQIVGDPVATQPTLGWVTAGTLKTLQISLPEAYNSYFISIEFSAWRLVPYQKVA